MRRIVALCCALLALVPVAAATLPPGFAPPVIPADNPQTPAKIALGQRLFFESRLSVDGKLACAGCHLPALAYSDGRTTPRGATGQVLPRNAPSLANVAWLPALGWASRTTVTLEQQMLVPLFGEHPVEMGLRGRESRVLSMLRSDAGYAQAFAQAFAGQDRHITLDNMVRAIAAFERTLVSGRSAFDRYVFDDDRSGMSAMARRGMALFYSPRTQCGECHSGINFSGPVRSVGHEEVAPVFARTAIVSGDTGLMQESGAAADRGVFRVPSLRNVALTAPYMHDGSLPSLQAVIEFYDGGGHQRPVRPLGLSRSEKADIEAFLHSLTDAAFAAAP